MTADAIAHMLDQEPFQPFKMCLTNGDEYTVQNPHMVALMRGKVFVALPNSEQWAFVSYLHIAALKTIANGHHPRRRGTR